MKKFAFAIFILLFVFTLPALSQDDARYLEKEITFTLNPDGSWQKEYHHRVKLVTYLAVTRLLGETFIEYNPQYQELKILKSETTMKDGKKVPSPPNAFNQVLPWQAHHFPYYSHLREMVVTHTGLERGAVIDLHYLLETRVGFMPYFSAIEFISDRFPIDRLILKVSVPASKKLNYILFYADITSGIKKDNNQTLYTFTFEDLKSYIEEPLNRKINQPAIVFSTASDWESVFPSVENAGPPPPELVKKVEDIKAAAANGDELYFKLQELVADEIENCSIGMDLNGFAIRNLQEVYTSNYGTAIEKAYLFYHLLKQLNIPAEIVAVPSDKKMAQEVPTVLQVDHFLIKIKGRYNKPIFLNPWENVEHLFPYELGGVTVYNLQEKSFKKIDNCTSSTSQVDISGHVKIDNEKTEGELNMSIKGYFFPYRSTLKDSQASLLKVIKDMLPVSKLEVKKIARLTPQQVFAVVSIEGEFLKELYQQRYMVDKFTFPYVTEEKIALEERDYPLHLDTAFTCKIKLEIEMSNDMDISFLTPLITVKNDIGYYIQQAESSTPGFVTLEMAMGIEKPLIESQDYSQFRKIVSKYFVKEPLIVVKKKEKTGNN
jgi:hypothetical protein